MKKKCSNKDCQSIRIMRYGFYKRKSDSKRIQRYRCNDCGKNFSNSTGTPEYNQKKRRINHKLIMLLSENVGQRPAARLLGVARKTIERRISYLGQVCKEKNLMLLKGKQFSDIQFDELITYEHTKCKPITVGAVVCSRTRKILGVKASPIPCSGLLAEKSLRKYGKRPFEKLTGIMEVFTRVTSYLKEPFLLSTDMDLRYEPLAVQVFWRQFNLKYEHRLYKSRNSRPGGQGELKRGKEDPLFPINHTFAMMRAHVNRLNRRAWNTTKRIENLQHHLEIYTYYHNKELTI